MRWDRAFALERRDILSPLIRNLGSMLVKGATPVEVLRQYMAKGDSMTRGRELNIHIGDLERGLRRPDLAPGRHGAGDGRHHARRSRCAAKRGSGLVYVGDGATSHRRLPRGHQLRRRAALPAGRHRREQRLRLLHARRRSRPRRAASRTRRSAYGVAGRAGRRQRRARGLPGHQGSGGARPRRRRRRRSSS